MSGPWLGVVADDVPLPVADVPVTPDAAPGSPELAAAVERAAGAAPVPLRAQHGSVPAAEGIDAVVDFAEELETAAQVTLLLSAGARTIPPEQLTRLHPPPES